MKSYPLLTKIFGSSPARRDPQLRSPAEAAAWSLLIPFGFIGLLCAFLPPRWETNDDVAMSMIAHGYGAVAYSSPQLVFSNVLWGKFVQTIPALFGVPGYSIATLGALIVASVAVMHALLLVNATKIVATAAVGLVLARATVFPQFTIISGLLAVAGIALLMVYQRHSEHKALIGGFACLFFLAFLIRWMEAVFVILVALPLLDYGLVKRLRSVQISIVSILVACVAAQWIDNTAYMQDEWLQFNEFNALRVLITDYGVTTSLASKPEALIASNLTPNDLQLLSRFFFLDPQIADPAILRTVLQELPHTIDPVIAAKNGLSALSVLGSVELLPLFIAATALLALHPSRSLLLSWFIFIAVIVFFGALGRGGVTRIYYAPLTLLIIAPILNGTPSILPQALRTIALTVAFLATTSIVVSESVDARRQMEIVKKSLDDLPEAPIIAWGGSFPYQLAYPVLSTPRQLKLYALGTFTLAPYSTVAAERRHGQALLDRLKSGEPMLFVAGKKKIVLFVHYVETRLKLRAKIMKLQKLGRHTVYTVQLLPNEPTAPQQ